MMSIAKAVIVPFKDEVPASQPQCAAVHKNYLISFFFFGSEVLKKCRYKLKSAFVEL